MKYFFSQPAAGICSGSSTLFYRSASTSILPKTTAHRHLNILLDNGYVQFCFSILPHTCSL